jgi:2-oxoglutarate ferredoxin oxidoreductase subunit gamma
MEKFENSIVPEGALLVNSSLISRKASRKDIKTYYIPANDMAGEMGNNKVANMIMLGAFLEASGAVQQQEVAEVVAELFGSKKPELVTLNKEALSRGAQWVRDH